MGSRGSLRADVLALLGSLGFGTTALAFDVGVFVSGELTPGTGFVDVLSSDVDGLGALDDFVPVVLVFAARAAE